MGPLTSAALDDYVTRMTDQYLKYRVAYLTKTKSDALSTIEIFVKSLAIPMGMRVQRRRTANGGEYTGQVFKDLYFSTGIRHEFAFTNTLQQLGVSLRDGGIPVAMTGCLLEDTSLPPFPWRDRMFSAADLLNHVRYSMTNTMAPCKQPYGTEENPFHLRVIGARPFVHVKTHTTTLVDKVCERSMCA